MGQRILVLLLSAFAVCVPQVVVALGLGEISLKSALNQPLDAEIKLLEVRDLTEAEILVGLASQEDFDRVGVDRPYFLTDLKFKVELQGPSGPVIHVSSRKPVREPFLNFVLQAQWPSGRLLREYTLLMDLPVFSGEQSQPVAAAQTPGYTVENTPSRQSTPAPKTNYNPRSSFDQAPSRPSVSQQTQSQGTTSFQSGESNLYPDDSYGPVQANDTLWEIASRMRPDRGVSIQQTMLAIQRLNPEAFINNNINLLRKGQILRVPSREQIVEYNKRQAIQEVAVQNTQWSGDPNGGFASGGGAQLEASRGISGVDDEPVSNEGRLKLTSPDEVSGSMEGRGSGAGDSSLEALENELAITLEQLDKSSRENSDLKSRIESLEEQISTMERMIEISNEDMRKMELAAEKNRQALEATEAGETSEAEPETETQVADAESGFGGEAEPADVTDEQQTADQLAAEVAATVEPTPEPTAEPTPAPTPKPTPVPAPPQKTIVDHIMDNIIFIVAGLVVIILAALLFIRHRNTEREFAESEEDFLSQPAFEDLQAETPEEEAFTEDLDLGEPEDHQEDEYEQDQSHVAAEAQTEDVVAEADIYIAYGKYDQAEEMLLKALERDPDHTDARLKLLEVYATQQDADRFDPHFARLLSTGSPEAKQRGHQLREGISGADPFDESLYDTTFAAASHLAAEELESSLSDMDAQLESESESDFDALDLDLDSQGSKEEESLELDDGLDFELDLGAPEDTAGTDDELEFSLDLGDDDAGKETAEEAGEIEFELPADSSDDSDDDLSIDLDLDESEEEVESFQSDDFDLDFDLDSESEEEAAASVSKPVGLNLTDDLESLDVEPTNLDLSSEDSLGDYELGGLETEGETENPEDDDALEFDLSGLDDGPGLDDLELETADLSQSEEFEAPVEEDEDEFNLDELSLDPEMEAATSEQEPESADDSEDDFDLSDDLDLSALDQELDALTSDLGVEEADIANLESIDSLGSETPAKPAVMEEPITDFDDFEQELESDLAEVSAEAPDDLEAELELPGEDDDLELDVADELELDDGSDADDSLFDEAVANVPKSDLDFEIPEIDPESDDDDLGFLSDSDETATKLDLARAYIDMGDAEGAKDILDEIIKEGNAQQKQEAESLLARV